MQKVYLGDSVYVEVRAAFPFGAELILTTENGGAPSNTIVLGQSEWESLVLYVKKLENHPGLGEEPAEGTPL